LEEIRKGNCEHEYEEHVELIGCWEQMVDEWVIEKDAENSLKDSLFLNSSKSTSSFLSAVEKSRRGHFALS